jgi:hypothetical protein
LPSTPRVANADIERQLLKEQMEALAEISRDVELGDANADDDDEVCDEDVGFSASVLAAHAGVISVSPLLFELIFQQIAFVVCYRSTADLSFCS